MPNVTVFEITPVCKVLYELDRNITSSNTASDNPSIAPRSDIFCMHPYSQITPVALRSPRRFLTFLMNLAPV